MGLFCPRTWDDRIRSFLLNAGHCWCPGHSNLGQTFYHSTPINWCERDIDMLHEIKHLLIPTTLSNLAVSTYLAGRKQHNHPYNLPPDPTNPFPLTKKLISPNLNSITTYQPQISTSSLLSTSFTTTTTPHPDIHLSPVLTRWCWLWSLSSDGVSSSSLPHSVEGDIIPPPPHHHYPPPHIQTYHWTFGRNLVLILVPIHSKNNNNKSITLLHHPFW